MQGSNSSLLGQALQAANDMGGMPVLQLAVQHHQQQQQLLHAVQAAQQQRQQQQQQQQQQHCDTMISPTQAVSHNAGKCIHFSSSKLISIFDVWGNGYALKKLSCKLQSAEENWTIFPFDFENLL